jgi:FtsZ family, C-terminal domain
MRPRAGFNGRMWQWQYGNHPPLPWWSRNGAVAQSGQGPRDRSRGGRQEITGGKNLTLYEVDEATTRIREVDADANIIVGATFDRQCPPTPAARSYPGAGAVIQGVVNIVRPGNEPATLEFLRRDAHYRDTGATKCNSPTDWSAVRPGTPPVSGAASPRRPTPAQQPG